MKERRKTCEINLIECPYYSDGECTFENSDRPKVVAVDLDGTILEYNGWRGHSRFGKPIEGAKEALEELKRRGFIIVIWTTRFNTKEIGEYLRRCGIPFDYINENPYQPPDCSNKIYADYYIDDRAVEFRGDWASVLGKILSSETSNKYVRDLYTYLKIQETKTEKLISLVLKYLKGEDIDVNFVEFALEELRRRGYEPVVKFEKIRGGDTNE